MVILLKYLSIIKELIYRSLTLKSGASLVAQMVESACNAGDLGLIPGSGRFPEGGHGNPLQCSCLENSLDRVAWRAHRAAKSQTRLSD